MWPCDRRLVAVLCRCMMARILVCVMWAVRTNSTQCISTRAKKSSTVVGVPSNLLLPAWIFAIRENLEVVIAFIKRDFAWTCVLVPLHIC